MQGWYVRMADAAIWMIQAKIDPLKMSETWGNCFGSLRSYAVSILDSDVILSSTQCVWRSQEDGEIPEIFQRSLHLGRIVAFLIVPVFRGGTSLSPWHDDTNAIRHGRIVAKRFWPACGRNVLRPLLTSPWKSLKKCQLQHWWSQQLRHKFKMIKKSSVQEYHEISWNKMKCVFYVFGAVPQRTCPDMKTGNFNSFASNVKSNLPLKSIEIHVPSIDKLVNWRGMHQKRARRTCHHHRPSPSC